MDLFSIKKESALTPASVKMVFRKFKSFSKLNPFQVLTVKWVARHIMSDKKENWEEYPEEIDENNDG